MSGTDTGYAAAWLSVCYAMSGTDIGYDSTSLSVYYSMSSTDKGNAAASLRVCYAMSGTHLAYAAARRSSQCAVPFWPRARSPTLSAYASAMRTRLFNYQAAVVERRLVSCLPTPRSSFRGHGSRFIVHSSQFIDHSSQFTVHSSQFTDQCSRLTLRISLKEQGFPGEKARKDPAKCISKWRINQKSDSKS
eukprot:3291839-Rhodomonas_salina.2